MANPFKDYTIHLEEGEVVMEILVHLVGHMEMVALVLL